MSDPRPCERKCAGPCGEWKHHSRFVGRKRRSPNGTVWEFNKTCRDCEQKARNEKKNADRPLAIIQNRAASAATKAGVSREFFWVQMNYRALVPILRALLSPDGLCLGCGHSFLGERDIQIEHWYPPRSVQDWALLHTRNLRFTCASCNGTKSHKPPLQWLDEQEGARLSNLKQPTIDPPPPPPPSSIPAQLSLF
jgi:hypothetical protein